MHNSLQIFRRLEVYGRSRHILVIIAFSRMCSLGECSPPPHQGYVTVCELNGDLITAPAGDAADPSKFTQGVQVMNSVHVLKLNIWPKNWKACHNAEWMPVLLQGLKYLGPQASCPQNFVRSREMLRPRAQMALENVGSLQNLMYKRY